jgi:hypothetical protein
MRAARAPVSDPERSDRLWQQVVALSGAYTMNPGVPQTATTRSTSDAKIESQRDKGE